MLRVLKVVILVTFIDSMDLEFYKNQMIEMGASSKKKALISIHGAAEKLYNHYVL